MSHRVLVLAMLAVAACNRPQTSCTSLVPPTLLHEIQCDEAPQGICFAEYDNGF